MLFRSRDTACNHEGVLLVQRGLSLFLRPIFPVGHAVLAAVQEVDLVKPLPVAHLHNFGFEIAHGRVGAAVLAAGLCICLLYTSPGKSVDKSTQRRQLDTLLDGISDKGLRIVTATAKEVAEVEHEDK